MKTIKVWYRKIQLKVQYYDLPAFKNYFNFRISFNSSCTNISIKLRLIHAYKVHFFLFRTINILLSIRLLY